VQQISAPAFHISGWYDIFLSAAFENYQGMRQRSAMERARQNQRLSIGPWSRSNFSGSSLNASSVPRPAASGGVSPADFFAGSITG
jgi:predicted acyl esterase